MDQVPWYRFLLVNVALPIILALITNAAVIFVAIVQYKWNPFPGPPEPPRTHHNYGEIVYSLLDPEQFKELYGKGWRLMDGSSLVGTKLRGLVELTTLPDARGLFLRGKNNGRIKDGNPNGELKIGDWQKDTIGPHSHIFTIEVTDKSDFLKQDKGLFRANGIISPQNYNLPITGSPEETSETRPRNITVNIYIKVD